VTTADVLVIGGGPSGLFAAAELARHGVRARIVEREPEPHHQARATALQPATLELLHRAGVLEPFLESSVQLGPWHLLGPELEVLREARLDVVDSRWPFLSSLPQWRTEQILTAHLEALGGGLERGVTVTAIEPNGDAVTVYLQSQDGTTETVEAAYVIGAGGARSMTRASMGDELEGDTYPGLMLAADVRLESTLPSNGHAVAASSSGFVLLGALPDERWITFIGYLSEDDGARGSAGAGLEQVASLLAQRVGDRMRLLDVAWSSVFRCHRRLAPRLVEGRRFLVGDAGHLSSPLGGEGLNAGLHDGADLAWKLALTLRGRAQRALLESYLNERAAADRHALEVSDTVHRGLTAIIDAFAAGDPLPDVPDDPETVKRFLTARSMLDVSYEGSPIVGEHLSGERERPPGPAPGERYPDRHTLDGTCHHLLLSDGEASIAALAARWAGLLEFRRISGSAAARAGIADGGAALVRPDGYLGFRAVPADEPGLAALDAHLVSYLIPSPVT
jgi:2-polyprenyl-6-methoxyphenol hydroxylase-like FAD-dependent oxidoreductase